MEGVRPKPSEQKDFQGRSASPCGSSWIYIIASVCELKHTDRDRNVCVAELCCCLRTSAPSVFEFISACSRQRRGGTEQRAAQAV